MSLRRRLFLAFALLAGLSLLLFLDILMAEVKPAMRKAVEETLVDTSLMLAELARPDMESGRLGRDAAGEIRSGGELAEALRRYTGRHPNATVWGVRKDAADHRVYITDHRGVVLFDTAGPGELGRDYSQWNDVHKTLRGEYGARTSPVSPDARSVMYVAAPILAANGTLLGVVSVGKPGASLEPYFQAARRRLEASAVWLFAAALLLALGLAWWQGRDVLRLARHAEAVGRGERPRPPRLRTPEMRQLADVVAAMRASLEGREHVERTLLALAHALKSPLAGVAGAVELLEDPAMPDADRARFLEQARVEAERLGRLLDRLLALARVEARQTLERSAPVDLALLCRDLLDEHRFALEQRALRVEDGLPVSPPPGLRMQGDPLLIRLALAALLENAIEFSSPGGRIRLEAAEDPRAAILRLVNDGPAIPDYALPRVFERFYSLPRPDGGRSSTGLGLTLAREVALLHGGSLALENIPGGVAATLTLPRRLA